MRRAVIGIDLGTSSVKIRASTEDGVFLAQVSRPYPTQCPRDGWAEQDPETWWQALVDGMQELTGRLSTEKVQIAGIGLTGQMHSLVLLNRSGKVVRPCITWMDSRAKDLVPWVAKSLLEAGLHEQVLNHPAAGLTLLPLLWLFKNEKTLIEELIQKQGMLLFVKDYIRFRLTGELAGDITDASASLMLDVPNRSWSGQVCKLFGIPASLLPGILDSEDIAGYVSASAAKILGLPVGIPVAAGAGDQQAAALATGVLEPGRIQLMLGTGAQVGTPILEYQRGFPEFLNVFCHVHGGLLQGSVQNAGSALDWVCRILGVQWDDLWMANACRYPDAPFFLPYLTGERAPVLAPNALGSWFNLRLGTDRNRLLYSALEGVAWSIGSTVKGLIEAAGSSTVSVEIRCSGGGASQPSYVGLISDSLGMPITTLDYHGASVSGAVALGATAAGLVSNVQEASRVFGLHTIGVVEPDSAKGLILQERYVQFASLRDTYLKNLGSNILQ